jgi:hypothetical protein
MLKQLSTSAVDADSGLSLAIAVPAKLKALS